MFPRSILVARTIYQNVVKTKFDSASGIQICQLDNVPSRFYNSLTLNNRYVEVATGNHSLCDKCSFIRLRFFSNKNIRDENKTTTIKPEESKPIDVKAIKVGSPEEILSAANDSDKNELNLDITKTTEPIKDTKVNSDGSSDTNEDSTTPPAQQRKRKRVDLMAETVDRNFITPVKAMANYILKPSDLEGLPKTKRRSPFECEPPITVYWLKDVEAKALEVWKSKENLKIEQNKREIEKKKYQQNIFSVKRRLRDYRREVGKQDDDIEAGLEGRSGRVVLTAIAVNGANFLIKIAAYCVTSSHSMFSESMHSLADTINQVILAYGIHKSIQIADSKHPYGYANMKYVSSLISGVGILCVGTGLSFYHGITGMFATEPPPDYFWAFIVLGMSLVSEGATCYVALQSVIKGAESCNTTIKDYILRGQDPSVNVVLLEDFAAVIGVCVASASLLLSTYLNSPMPDAVGSLIIGCILGSVASFIIYTNVAALVGRSIPEKKLNKINSELETDIMVRAIHDVKGIDMGNYLIRYKAEVDFDGRELTRSYLDKQDLNELLKELKKLNNIDELEDFILKHGENIVDMMGGEIDRIEMKLRKKHPEIRHCDLEIL